MSRRSPETAGNRELVNRNNSFLFPVSLLPVPCSLFPPMLMTK